MTYPELTRRNYSCIIKGQEGIQASSQYILFFLAMFNLITYKIQGFFSIAARNKSWAYFSVLKIQTTESYQVSHNSGCPNFLPSRYGNFSSLNIIRTQEKNALSNAPFYLNSFQCLLCKSQTTDTEISNTMYTYLHSKGSPIDISKAIWQ